MAFFDSSFVQSNASFITPSKERKNSLADFEGDIEAFDDKFMADLEYLFLSLEPYVDEKKNLTFHSALDDFQKRLEKLFEMTDLEKGGLKKFMADLYKNNYSLQTSPSNENKRLFKKYFSSEDLKSLKKRGTALRIIFASALIWHLIDSCEVKLTDGKEFWENYKSFDCFKEMSTEDWSIVDGEVKFLLQYERAMRCAKLFLPHDSNKQLLIAAAALQEDSSIRYVTGGDPKPATMRRERIFETLYNCSPIPRPPRSSEKKAVDDESSAEKGTKKKSPAKKASPSAESNSAEKEPGDEDVSDSSKNATKKKSPAKKASPASVESGSAENVPPVEGGSAEKVTKTRSPAKKTATSESDSAEKAPTKGSAKKATAGSCAPAHSPVTSAEQSSCDDKSDIPDDFEFDLECLDHLEMCYST